MFLQTNDLSVDGIAPSLYLRVGFFGTAFSSYNNCPLSPRPWNHGSLVVQLCNLLPWHNWWNHQNHILFSSFSSGTRFLRAPSLLPYTYGQARNTEQWSSLQLWMGYLQVVRPNCNCFCIYFRLDEAIVSRCDVFIVSTCRCFMPNGCVVFSATYLWVTLRACRTPS